MVKIIFKKKKMINLYVRTIFGKMITLGVEFSNKISEIKGNYKYNNTSVLTLIQTKYFFFSMKNLKI